jgi:hypothetical protein
MWPSADIHSLCVTAGGGGKRAEAKRLLAEAAVRRGSAAAAAKGSSKQQQQQSAGSRPPAAAAAAAAAGEKDWRLTGPGKQKLPEFKPGAVTWDTDDYSTAAGVKQLQKQAAQKEAAAGGAAGAAAIAARPNPKAWYDKHHAQYKQSAFTTGGVLTQVLNMILNQSCACTVTTVGLFFDRVLLLSYLLVEGICCSCHHQRRLLQAPPPVQKHNIVCLPACLSALFESMTFCQLSRQLVYFSTTANRPRAEMRGGLQRKLLRLSALVASSYDTRVVADVVADVTAATAWR